MRLGNPWGPLPRSGLLGPSSGQQQQQQQQQQQLHQTTTSKARLSYSLYCLLSVCTVFLVLICIEVSVYFGGKLSLKG